jgi:hypothetical protein
MHSLNEKSKPNLTKIIQTIIIWINMLDINKTKYDHWFLQVATEYRTNLITSWRQALLEKLTVSQLGKIFPQMLWSLKVITVFTTACYLPLSWD